MQQRIIGEAAASTAASCPQLLATLRAQLTALTFDSPWFTAAEQLRANHHAHECEEAGRLGRWLVNTQATLDRRAAEHQRQCGQVTAARPVEAQPLFRATCLLDAGTGDLLSQLEDSLPLDYLAGAADCRAAATFRVGQGLTYSILLHG